MLSAEAPRAGLRSADRGGRRLRRPVRLPGTPPAPPAQEPLRPLELPPETLNWGRLSGLRASHLFEEIEEPLLPLGIDRPVHRNHLEAVPVVAEGVAVDHLMAVGRFTRVVVAPP